MDLEILETRELNASDLALLATERTLPSQATMPVVVRLRERHHHLARVLATGATHTEASAITGYEPARISVLLNSPSFKGLVEDYRRLENAAMADFMERATNLSLTAIDTLQDDLERETETGESYLPASMRLELAKFAADRTGHAPVQKTFNVNANVDMGSRLAAARKRLQNGSGGG